MCMWRGQMHQELWALQLSEGSSFIILFLEEETEA